MPASTETTIPLDRKHRVIRSGDRWALQRFQPDGTWDAIDLWTGPRRSLYRKCEKHQIVPSREAEALLARLPEQTGFIEHT